MEEGGPAIRALGHLFKLTQVNLWDDEALDVGVGFSTQLHKSFSREKVGSNEECSIKDFSPSAEDLETSRQMNVLGLPLSFQTSKQKRAKHKTTRVKKKDPRKTTIYLQNDINDEMLDVIRFPDEKITAAACIIDEVNLVSSLGEGGLLCPDIGSNTDEATRISNVGDASTFCSAVVSNPSSDFNLISDSICLLERDTELSLSPKLDNGCSTGSSMPEDGNGHGGMTELYQDPNDYKVATDDAQCEILHHYNNTDIVCAYETTARSQSTEMVDCNTTGSTSEDVYGDWRSCWDEHFMQTYYYNVVTLVSTWDPPPGVTDSEIPGAFDDSAELVVEIEQSKANISDSGESGEPSVSCVLQPSLDMSKESIEQSKANISDSGESVDPSVSRVLQPSLDMSKETIEQSKTNIPDSGESVEPSVSCVLQPGLDMSKESVEQSKANISDSGESVDPSVSCVLQPSLDMSKESIEQSKTNIPDSGESVEPSVDMSKESMYGNGSHCETYSESREIVLLAESCCDSANKKKNNTTRILKFEGILHSANEDIQIRGGFEEISPSINKYWLQRYLLFSRFDEGIQMDEEGWFSVTPERIAAHHAMRCEGGVMIDCFTGVGGNAIQFAKRSRHVIAIDIDPRKIDYAQHNAAIYGVEDHIDFVRGDCFHLASLMKADTVFLSPPWGGPDYSKVKTFDMNIMLQPHDGHFLFNISKKIAPKVVMYLPRNVDLNQLAEIALSSSPPWSLEVEKNYLNGKLKAITAYFSEPALQND